jgi:hypothetical protein
MIFAIAHRRGVGRETHVGRGHARDLCLGRRPVESFLVGNFPMPCDGPTTAIFRGVMIDRL